MAFEGEELDVFAMDLDGADPLTRPFSAAGDPTITLLYLPHDLESMQLRPGRIPPSAGAPERSLPPFLAGFRTIEKDAALRWEQIEHLSDRLAEFRMSGFSVEECASAGGCYLDEPHADREDCTVPCPVAAPRLPESAETPLLPVLEPCPSGWVPRQIRSLVVCEPAEIASLCPAGAYAEGLPPPVVFFDPQATSLAEVAASAPDGTTIALPKGAHFAGLVIDRELAIAGACAAETFIDAPAEQIGLDVRASLQLRGVTVRGGLTAVQVAGGTATIEDATLGETTGDVLRVVNGRASLRRVAIDGAAGSGLSMDDAVVDAEDLRIRGGRAGIFASRSQATLERVTVESPQVGASVRSSTVSASDLIVHGAGLGLESIDSEVTLARASLVDLVRTGVRVLGRTNFDASDLTIEGAGALGLELEHSSRSQIRRFLAREIDGEGLFTGGDAIATLEDVTIERDGSSPDPLGVQCGFDVHGKSRVTATRVHLERLFRQGLCVNGEGSAQVSDVTALDVGDHGLYVFQDGALMVQRALVDGAADGVVAFLSTTLVVEDLTVRGMHGIARYVPPTMLGYPRGRGIYNNALASVRVERFQVSGCADAGLDLGSRDSAALLDGWVTDNQIGARITFEPKRLLERLQVSGNRLNFAAE